MYLKDDNENGKLDEEMEAKYRQAYIILILVFILIVVFIIFGVIYTKLY